MIFLVPLSKEAPGPGRLAEKVFAASSLQQMDAASGSKATTKFLEDVSVMQPA